MKCPFCAETIQDQAVICRFCNAALVDGEWTRVGPDVTARSALPQGANLTIRIAAVFFMFSALMELLAVQTPAALFGELRTGTAIMAYHLTYTVLFLAMGWGLWTSRQWGYRMMFFGTVFYTLDKIRYLLDGPAREAELALRLQGYEGLLGPHDYPMLLQMMNLVALVSVCCWWGFMLYLYFNRQLFRAAEDPLLPHS